MIIDPDMPTHWKTRMLGDLLEQGKPVAVYCLVCLWGHCQSRKKWIFDRLPPVAMKAICEFDGDADTLDRALIECGFITRNGNQVTVVGWEEHNSNLVNAWENGKKGGRPPKPTGNPPGNPEETHGKPTDNPDQTGGLPDKGDKGDKEEEPKEPSGSSGEQDSPAAEAIFSIPLTRGKFHHVTADDLAHYHKTYPAVDVEQSFRNMLEWLELNKPKRSGTVKGAKQRITSWLSRDQDKAGRSQPGAASPVSAEREAQKREFERQMRGAV